MKLKIKTIAFYPDDIGVYPIFYGFLNRILDYEIVFDELQVDFKNENNDYWDSGRIQNFSYFRKKLLEYF